MSSDEINRIYKLIKAIDDAESAEGSAKRELEKIVYSHRSDMVDFVKELQAQPPFEIGPCIGGTKLPDHEFIDKFVRCAAYYSHRIKLGKGSAALLICEAEGQIRKMQSREMSD